MKQFLYKLNASRPLGVSKILHLRCTTIPSHYLYILIKSSDKHIHHIMLCGTHSVRGLGMCVHVVVVGMVSVVKTGIVPSMDLAWIFF